MEKDIQYTSLLKQQLQQFSDENRFLEFKSNYQDVDRIGKYISALSNGACLDNEQKGYLYFGIDDTTHGVKGKMIDTQGYGIHKMFLSQKERFLPMPDYNRSTANEVVLTMPGTVIDENYSLMLLERKDLTLQEIVLLDKVQKGEPVSAEAVALLRKKKLVEGRKNSLIVAKEIAQITDQKAQYTKNRGLDDAYYKQLILTALEQHKQLSRPEIDDLLMSKLPDVLNEKQKETKISTLLTYLRRKGKIYLAEKKLWKKV